MNRRIYTENTFRYETAKAGDLVTEDVVNNAVNCLPPACMRIDCTQMGEPYSHQLDHTTGKYRPTYATFRHVTEGIWEYCGNCFRGENVEQGN